LNGASRERSISYPGSSLYDRLGTIISYQYDFFHLIADFDLRNDGKYSPAEVYWLGRYFYMNNGGIELDFGNLSLAAGRFVHRDYLATPYSLFISSQNLPAVQADITFDGDFFYYESRWIRLNTRSLYGYPERGANYKVFGLKFGNVRFGLQDSAVYVGRSFDEEYFFSPIPHILTQIITKSAGKPWAENTNDNSLTGLFFDWSHPQAYLYSQLLVDDINLDFLIPPCLIPVFNPSNIPSKMAWSFGGYYDFSFGRFGFYHAGATKFTFEATSGIYPYEYAYYPATEYTLKDGTPMVLDYVDNYIGYLYGENNLAFLFDYSHTVLGIELYTSLEYVISGSKSPANPWQEYADFPDYKNQTGGGTVMLDDPVLEHTIVSRLNLARRFGNFTINLNIKLGGVFNKLGLEPDAGGADIFRPQAGAHELILHLTFGVTYLWRIN
jgi:hypothetical protein